MINPGTDWRQHHIDLIAVAIRERRTELGLSTQQVADACAGFGFVIPRAVLSNLENGRRASMDVCEMLVLARALDLPPVALLCPAGADGLVEILPGERMGRAEAAAWAIGAPDASAVAALETSLTEARDAAGRAQCALSSLFPGKYTRASLGTRTPTTPGVRS